MVEAARGAGGSVEVVEEAGAVRAAVEVAIPKTTAASSVAQVVATVAGRGALSLNRVRV